MKPAAVDGLVARLVMLAAALLLASAYLLNVGSLYAPTNGDEMVYLHIARLTSESGHLLPLVSDLQTPSGAEMRNTKPPLLFWQAMWAGSLGWDLWVLRLPYVVQTLLCALLVGYVALAVRRQAVLTTALLAAALYLGFFATYRYGRPVLPSSTESLFLFGVCAFVMARESSWRAHPAWLATGAGLLMIPALLVKSFVLVAPVGLWLCMALWVTNKASAMRFWHSLWPSILAVVIGLAGFALWFALDPHPAAVWREFIVGENFSTKFSDSRSDSVLSILLAPLLNAGLLAPLVLGLCWTAGKKVVQAWRNKRFGDLSTSEKLLWLWVLAWLVVFSIPSQRSARYVIPVMPAVAVLLALYAPRISRIWWLLTLALITLATAALGWIAYALAQVVSYSPLYFVCIALVLVLCGVGLCGVGLCLRRYRTLLTAACAVAWLALLGALAAPFDGVAGRYDAATQNKLTGQTILVPQNFNAQFERYAFILPGAQLHPYQGSFNDIPHSVMREFSYAILVRPLQIAELDDGGFIQRKASRLVLRSRQNPSEVTWSVLTDPRALARVLVEFEVLVAL
jgi:4-amino-4-deoxy-L-arabinose transferase-like glycosyltransferase